MAQLMREVLAVESQHAAATSNESVYDSVPGWNAKTIVTAETGRLLHKLRHVRPMVKRISFVKVTDPGTVHFVPNLTGLPKTLTTQARTFTGSSASNERFSRLRLMGRPKEAGSSNDRAPWLEIDIRHDKNGVPLIDVVRLIAHTTITDIMLPDLSTDLRVTTRTTLELASVARSATIIDFIRKFQLRPDGRFLSPWSLKLDIPTSAIMEETRATPLDTAMPKIKNQPIRNRASRQKESAEDTEVDLTEVDFFPLSLEDIETTKVTFRTHDLEINTVDGGRFGAHEEGVRLRMMHESTKQELKEAALVPDLVEPGLNDTSFELSDVHDDYAYAKTSIIYGTLFGTVCERVNRVCRKERSCRGCGNLT
jgi:hypothetical protein